MLPDDASPIVAITTAAGRGAVGIVRISGPAIDDVVLALCGRPLLARHATYLPFLDANGQTIDHGLAIYFAAPHSYTGEAVLELQAHGGPVVLQLLMARCLQAGTRQGLRLARPGEFTQRAFLNDKIDLAQAEAIADLIDASTEAAARSASRSMTGVFSAEIAALRDQLVGLRMLVESTLDFPDEEIDFLQQADAQGQLVQLQHALAKLQNKARQGALLREGLTVVIAGQPNVGKSSLLNALAGMELAIVTPVPGTTRDKIQQTIQIDGVPLHIVDTAGLRDSEEPVEQMGIERAWGAIAAADVVLFLHDLERAKESKYAADDAEIGTTLSKKFASGLPVLHVWNKADLASQPRPETPEPNTMWLSAKTGEGLPELRHALLGTVGWQALPEGSFSARARHVQALQNVALSLEAATKILLNPGAALDLLAEELRLAQNHLNQITGEFNANDLLGVIFSSFCIGK